MTEQSSDHVRTLFTEIGTIMEDASVIAIIWDGADLLTIERRYQQLLNVHRKVDLLLEQIKAAIEGV